MFIGDPNDGNTLEPQICAANSSSLDTLRAIVKCSEGTDLVDHMTGDKTEAAWLIATSTSQIAYPAYFIEAIDFIRAK